MLKSILLNNEVVHFSKSDLPCLIHGSPKAGSSLFTISMVADLYSQGNKILFLSGYPMARDEFIGQTKATNTILAENSNNLFKFENKQVIFVKKEDSDLFIQLLNNLNDIDERVILVKNFDLFDKNILINLKGRKHFILSGNLDACSFTKDVLEQQFSTTILFSQPKVILNYTIPSIEKYHGFLWNKNKNGEVSLQM